MFSCVRLLTTPMDCIPPGSSVREIFQARILEWVAISSSRGSPWPRDRTHFSVSPGLAGRFLTAAPPGKPCVTATRTCWGSRTGAFAVYAGSQSAQPLDCVLLRSRMEGTQIFWGDWAVFLPVSLTLPSILMLTLKIRFCEAGFLFQK